MAGRRGSGPSRSPTRRRRRPPSRRVPTHDERRNTVVKLRLMRMGKKKQPTYRVVAADCPFAPQRPVHRDRRHLRARARSRRRSSIDNDKAVDWLQQGRPAHRDGREAAEDLRRLGRVQGRSASPRRADGSPTTTVVERRRRSSTTTSTTTTTTMTTRRRRRRRGHADAQAVLEYLVRPSSTTPTPSQVEVDEGGRRPTLNVTVGAGDMGRVIGKRGRVATVDPHRHPGRRRPRRRRGRHRVRRLIEPARWRRRRAAAARGRPHHQAPRAAGRGARSASPPTEPSRLAPGSRAAGRRPRHAAWSRARGRTSSAGSSRFDGVRRREAADALARHGAARRADARPTTPTRCGSTS